MKPLPRGRHGLSREFIAEHQRERLLAAIADSLDEHGYDGTTVAAISGRAGVSKSDFYRHFASKDECFFAAYDDAVERLRAEVLGGLRGADGLGRAGLRRARRGARRPRRASRRGRTCCWSRACAPGPASTGASRRAVESFVPYLRDGAPAGTQRRSAAGGGRRGRGRRHRLAARAPRPGRRGRAARRDSSRNLPSLR